jgi:endogenous inhibitor of DNA gyrase (YacG/DUF329 family)
MKREDTSAERSAARPCPICGKRADGAHRPFCSKRCADVDLQRWLAGVYVIPATEDENGAAENSDEAGVRR